MSKAGAAKGAIRVAGVVSDSIVDGPGLRMTVFVQGCLHGCDGCHNPGALPLDGGREVTAEELLAELDSNPLLDGVTLSGGEPLMQAGALIPFAEGVRARGLDLAVYTGWTFEELLAGAGGGLGSGGAGGAKDILALLGFASTLVDGPFLKEQKTMLLPFRGSKNQRILDVGKSLAEGRAVLSDDPAWVTAL